MNKSSIFNRLIGQYCRRAFYSLGRFRAIVRLPADLYLVPLLYGYLSALTWRVRFGADSIRRALQSPLAAPPQIIATYQEEQHLLALMQWLIAWIPYGRKHRCLIVSLAAYHYLRGRHQDPVLFRMGVKASSTGRGITGFHCWVDYGDGRRLDLDAPSTSNLVFEYGQGPKSTSQEMLA